VECGEATKMADLVARDARMAARRERVEARLAIANKAKKNRELSLLGFLML